VGQNSGEVLLIYLYDIHNIKEVLCVILYFISVVYGQYGNKKGYQVQ